VLLSLAMSVLLTAQVLGPQPAPGRANGPRSGPESLPIAVCLQDPRHAARYKPVLNSPTVADGAAVASGEEKVPIDLMVKRHDGATYLFAVGMRNAPTRGAFTVPGLPAKAVAEAIGEGRRIVVEGGRFADDFRPYDVHLYKIRPREPGASPRLP
jgi:hypothetical protein